MSSIDVPRVFSSDSPGPGDGIQRDRSTLEVGNSGPCSAPAPPSDPSHLQGGADTQRRPLWWNPVSASALTSGQPRHVVGPAGSTGGEGSRVPSHRGGYKGSAAKGQNKRASSAACPDGASDVRPMDGGPAPSSAFASSAPYGVHSALSLAEELEGYVSRCGLDVGGSIMPSPSGGRNSGAVATGGAAGAVSDEAVAELQLQTARKLRQLLSTNRDLLHLVQERNWIPLLLSWLQLHDRPSVQVEALWALTNIAGAGAEQHNSHLLLRHDAVPILVRLLSSPNEEVHEQALWILGSMAGEGAATRDTVLAAGVLRPLVGCLDRHSRSLSLQRIGSWALSNLADGQPRPVLDMHAVLPTLQRLLGSPDAEVLSHACWTLSHLCDGPSAHIQRVVESDLCVLRLVELLMHSSWRVTKPALRTIGNIVCAEDDTDYTEYILDAGAVPCLRQLICHSNREIQKEACWTLSNIAAGTMEQIQTVIESGAMPLLVKLAGSVGTDPEVKSEACWVVLNATSCGSDEQIETLVREGCVGVLGELLNEASMVMMALEGLERVLQVEEVRGRRKGGTACGWRVAAGSEETEGCGGGSLVQPAMIEALERHKSSAISKRASRIWKQHFVSCALCKKSFSKHSSKTHFCNECKCDVCSNCNCVIYHLSYQEEFWAESESRETAAASKAKKKSKKAKKKEKKKAKKKAIEESKDEGEVETEVKKEIQPNKNKVKDVPQQGNSSSGNGANAGCPSRSRSTSSSSSRTTSSMEEEAVLPSRPPPPRLPPAPGGKGKKSQQVGGANDAQALRRPPTAPPSKKEAKGPTIDLVSYLQQTGSILALAKLLDDTEDAGELGPEEYGPEWDEYDAELQMLSRMMLNDPQRV